MQHQQPTNQRATASAAPDFVLCGAEIPDVLAALRHVKADYAIRAILPPMQGVTVIDTALTIDDYLTLDFLEHQLAELTQQ